MFKVTKRMSLMTAFSGIESGEYRVVWHPEYHALRGEYELQARNANGDYENVLFSNDQTDFIRFVS